MAGDGSEVATLDPSFIEYLFTLNYYDCHFIVGNKKQTKPEKIGVVTQMLMAHSEVLQSEVLLKNHHDNKCVAVDDLYPDTFRNLLRYVYGFDNIGSLRFEEADSLLYAADKYMIEPLKARLAERLVDLLDTDNVCILLNNPACFRPLELSSAVTRILQYETNGILTSPQFLNLKCDALVRIFEQEAMNVDEIEVWRAAVRWAQHHTNSIEGKNLRTALESPSKHIRICTIDDYSFYNEVYPSGILTDKEAIMFSSSKALKKTPQDLGNFSSELKCRAKTSILCELQFERFQEKFMGRDVELLIITKKYAIELFPIQCIGEHLNSCEYGIDQKNLACDCLYECTITVTRITENNAPSELPEKIQLYTQIEYSGEFTIPLSKEGNNIILSPNSKYRVIVKFNEVVSMYESKFDNSYDSDYISVIINYPDRFNYFAVPFKTLSYRPLNCYNYQPIHNKNKSDSDRRLLLTEQTS